MYCGATRPAQKAVARAKLKELILMVTKRSSQRPRLNVLRLGHLLWRIDSTAWATTGHAITNTVYIKGEYGIEPDDFAGILAEMVAAGDLKFTPMYPKARNRAADAG